MPAPTESSPSTAPVEVARATPAVSDSEPRFCLRHPGRETLVSCGRCRRPFCPECLIHTPAGQRCYACAGVRRDAARRAGAGALLKVFGIAAVGSAVAAVAGLLFALLAALVSGSVAGQVLAPLVNRRSRRTVCALGLLALALGALAGAVTLQLVRTAALPIDLPTRLIVVRTVALLYAQNPVLWLFVAVAAAVGYQRMR